MTVDEFKTFALHHLANLDTQAMVRALQTGNGTLADGAKELLRLDDAHKAFPAVKSLPDMWDVDRLLRRQSGGGRPSTSNLRKAMTDPAWVAVNDLKALRKLWRDTFPGKQVPSDLLVDIVCQYRDVNRETVASRKGRSKKRHLDQN